jgi:hypothetical protein
MSQHLTISEAGAIARLCLTYLAIAFVVWYVGFAVVVTIGQPETLETRNPPGVASTANQGQP